MKWLLLHFMDFKNIKKKKKNQLYNHALVKVC